MSRHGIPGRGRWQVRRKRNRRGRRRGFCQGRRMGRIVWASQPE